MNYSIHYHFVEESYHSVNVAYLVLFAIRLFPLNDQWQMSINFFQRHFKFHHHCIIPGTSTGAKKGHIGKRTPTEYWTDTLRRTGVGITPETLGQQHSMTGLKKQDMSYKSTSHYLRQVAGTEKLAKTMPADSVCEWITESLQKPGN